MAWTAEQLAQILPDGLRVEPEAEEYLIKLLGPVASVASYFDAKTEQLGALLDMAETPADLLPMVAGLVGMGREWAPVATAGDDDLRALAPVAVRLWKLKGTRPSWRSVVSAITGSRAIVLDWFALRTVQGTTGEIHLIPAPGSSMSGNYSPPEYVTDVWYMDPDGDADRDLLARLLDAMRGAGERINLYRATFVDDCGAGLAFWEAEGVTGTLGANPDTWEIVSSGGRWARADVGGEEDTWANYHLSARLAVTGAATVDILRSNPLKYYTVEIDQASGTVELFRIVAGTPASVATAAQPMAAGHPYKWTIEGWTGSSNVIRVYFEGSLLINFTDTVAARPSNGGIRWRGEVGGTAVLSSLLLWELGTTPTRIGPPVTP